MVDVDNKVL